MRDALFGAIVGTRSTHLARRRIGPRRPQCLTEAVIFLARPKASDSAKAYRRTRDLHERTVAVPALGSALRKNRNRTLLALPDAAEIFEYLVVRREFLRRASHPGRCHRGLDCSIIRQKRRALPPRPVRLVLLLRHKCDISLQLEIAFPRIFGKRRRYRKSHV